MEVLVGHTALKPTFELASFVHRFLEVVIADLVLEVFGLEPFLQIFLTIQRARFDEAIALVRSRDHHQVRREGLLILHEYDIADLKDRGGGLREIAALVFDSDGQLVLLYIKKI